LFEAEVLHLSKDASTGVELLNRALARGDFGRDDMDACWFGISTVLGALGNISKIFFPSDKGSRHKRRGRQLRKAFKVADDSPLQNRALRNAIEHLDERIDDWFHDSVTRHLGDRCIGRIEAFPMSASEMLRHYDPTTNIVSVAGEQLDLNALLAEIRAIVSRIEERHQPTWLFPWPSVLPSA